MLFSGLRIRFTLAASAVSVSCGAGFHRPDGSRPATTSRRCPVPPPGRVRRGSRTTVRPRSSARSRTGCRHRSVRGATCRATVVVVVGRQSDEYTGLRAADRMRVDSGVFQSFPGDFEQQPLLGIDSAASRGEMLKHPASNSSGFHDVRNPPTRLQMVPGTVWSASSTRRRPSGRPAPRRHRSRRRTAASRSPRRCHPAGQPATDTHPRRSARWRPFRRSPGVRSDRRSCAAPR